MASRAAAGGGKGTQAAASGGYTAVVHFHGMGSQRRLEETARMVDALDLLQRNSKAATQPLGMLLDIEPALEQRRDPYSLGRNESFIRTVWKDPADPQAPVRPLRFYEVYWAPIMADGKSVVRTLQWIGSQLFRPILTGSTPWRERQRLRRSTLMEMNQASFWKGTNQHDADIERLATRYDAFESLDAQQAYPKGKFSEFLDFVRTQNGLNPEQHADPATIQRLLILAGRWRRRYRFTEARTFFVLTSFMLGAALATAGLLYGALSLLRILLEATRTATWVSGLLPQEGGLFQMSAMLVLAAGSVLGIKRFITDALGDVEAWSTFAETDAKHQVRKEVIAYATGLLGHILNDPACSRVVVTAHSLGTAIAHDTLLAIARNNRAGKPRDRMKGDPEKGGVDLSKIEHLVTFGSPIDKIEYFFESSRSQSHRYRRLVEDLRGDIGTVPFVNRRIPHIHWINVWDDADLVSGSLESPTAALQARGADEPVRGARNPPVREARNLVDNVHLEGSAFPDPVAAHIRYLCSRSFVALLFGIIVHREKSFVALSLQDHEAPNPYAGLIAGPGSKPGRRLWWQLAALALPWIIALTWLLHHCCQISATPGIVIAVVIAAVLAVAWIHSARKGPLDPI